jgi:hypothetical protein
MPNDFRPAVGHRFTFRTEPVLCFLWRGHLVKRLGELLGTAPG